MLDHVGMLNKCLHCNAIPIKGDKSRITKKREIDISGLFIKMKQKSHSPPKTIPEIYQGSLKLIIQKHADLLRHDHSIEFEDCATRTPPNRGSPQVLRPCTTCETCHDDHASTNQVKRLNL